jgi:hypothetical protein
VKQLQELSKNPIPVYFRGVELSLNIIGMIK